MTEGKRITYQDIHELQSKTFAELKEIRREIADLRTEVAVQRISTGSLLRRDTIGYVWDSLNTLIAAVIVVIMANTVNRR